MRVRVVIAGLVLAALGPAGCEDPRGNPPPAERSSKPADRVWTAEAIAKDPQGYLVAADAKIGEQIAERERRLASLEQRQADVTARGEKLARSLTDVENIHNRMEQAYRRAEDEDRWPVKMAGRTFERDKAKAIIEQTARYLEDRKPLAQAYDEATSKMRSAANGLRGDIGKLQRMRERLALDLERVRLNQGMAELEQLRQTEAELASMAQTLATAGRDELAQLSELQRQDAEPIDVEQLLR